MKHKGKLTLARKLRTNEELVKRVPVFQTKAWELRKEAMLKKQANQGKKKVKTASKVKPEPKG